MTRNVGIQTASPSVTSQDHNCGKMLCKCHEMRQKTLFLVGFFFGPFNSISLGISMECD